MMLIRAAVPVIDGTSCFDNNKEADNDDNNDGNNDDCLGTII